MNQVDKSLLEALQEDATLRLADLADRVGLSTTACWKRIQHLEQAGVIRRRVALLDPKLVNVGVTVFVAIRTNQHNEEWMRNFTAAVLAIPEVVEFYRMSGETDYMLRIVVPDIGAYDAVYKRLIRNTQLFDVSSSFAMEQLKFTTALPLTYA
jgi:Lrp/AsnC family transcriptional regulator